MQVVNDDIIAILFIDKHGGFVYRWILQFRIIKPGDGKLIAVRRVSVAVYKDRFGNPDLDRSCSIR